MITTIKQWKQLNERNGHSSSKVNESLSKDRANKAKLDMLIQAAREMMEYKEKTKHFAELKKTGNTELEQLLDNMEATSIIANNVLVEVIKPYERHNLDTKEYTKFVEDSIDTIGEGYKQMHDKAIELSKTVKKGFAYTRAAQNKKGLETGTLESLNMFKKFTSWITEQISKFKNFLNSFKSDLTDIKSQALQFQNINESFATNNDLIIDITKNIPDERSPLKKNTTYSVTIDNNNDNDNWSSLSGTLKQLWNDFEFEADWFSDEKTEKYFDDNYDDIVQQIMNKFDTINESVYPGRESKYKSKIVEVLATNNDLSYLELFDKTGFTTTSEDYGLYRNIQLLLNDNIITRFKDGRKFRYNLDPSIDTTQIDMTDTMTGPVDNAPVIEALEKAKQVIENAEQEKYYEELANVKQKQVMDLLKEFGAKKVAIDDKIISLIEVQEGTRIDMEKYQDYMMNADEVSESIADMATNLFGLYTKVTKVSGSVRQYADDQGLEDGTLNATFDYVFKTVTKPEDNLNNTKTSQTEPVQENIGSWIIKVWRRIKRFFSNFRISSKRVDIALKNIN